MKRPPITFKGRRIETRWQRLIVFLARIVVVLSGLGFLGFSALIIMLGVNDKSWGLVAVGGVVALGSLGLMWAACTSKGKDVCTAAVILLMFR